MLYWITLIILLALLLMIAIYIWIMRKVKKEMDNESFCILTVTDCIVLLIVLWMSLDIMSALQGGQELYVNELPTYHYAGRFFSYVETDNEELKHLNGCDWNKYEKYGNYRIRYTRFTKFVLDIEKLD